MSAVTESGKQVILAAPRGYCAGVDRAIITVEKALETYGAPVYVRKEIVHNKHVVEDLRERGAIFVDELDEVPADALVVFSAHGVSPAVHAEAAQRELRTIDATCPLVTKVHREAVRFDKQNLDILLIGHSGHEEVEGTMGHAPDRTTLVESPEDVDALELDPDKQYAWISQTTLSVDETMETVDRLRTRLPLLMDPPSDDICYATQNRQQAVKQIAPRADLMIIVGSANSSNSVRLVGWPWRPAPRRPTGWTTPARWTSPGSTASPPWVSRPVRPCPKTWSRVSSTTCRSADSPSRWRSA